MRCSPQHGLQMSPPRAGQGRLPFRSEQYAQWLICLAFPQLSVWAEGE
jgi:hypothetical protein